MIGVYDFCGHYEWTFEWLRKKGGEALVRAYWDQCISQDSQSHARQLIQDHGFAGMRRYWAHTLTEEAPDGGFRVTEGSDVFRIDMHECPSKGFLLRNHLEQYHDYCDHCIGWIGPVMRDAGFVIDHEHNHCGQCWWEIRRKETLGSTGLPGDVSDEHDVRLRPDWYSKGCQTDKFRKATKPEDKEIE